MSKSGYSASVDAQVSAEIKIAASPDEVFSALTNERELAAWLGAVDDYSAREWAEEPVTGREWRSPAIAPDGSRGDVRGELLLVDAPMRLVSTWHASWDQYARTVVQFELTPIEIDGERGTRLTVTHSATAARVRQPSQFAAVRERGWTAMLARLSCLMNERLTV